GLLAKKIITGDVSNNTISHLVSLFTKRFSNFKRPEDVSEKDYLLNELSTNFYRFYINPSSWLYKPNKFFDVNERVFISRKSLNNDKCIVIVSKLENYTTLYEILIQITIIDLDVYYYDHI